MTDQETAVSSDLPCEVAEPLNILVICNARRDHFGTTANMLFDYLDAFPIYSRHNIFTLSNTGRLPRWIDLAQYDAVVIHWSIYMLGENYIAISALKALAAFKGLKVLFLQDEYRTISAFWEVIRRVKFDVLFTCMHSPLTEVVYPSSELPNLRKVPILTGYVPGSLCQMKVPAIDERSIDIFYRGRRVPYSLGRIAQEKHWIAEEFERRAAGEGLALDLGTKESQRIYGLDWLNHLMNARATLGVESAASILDFDGSIQARVDSFMKKYPDATYDECEKACFPGLDGKWNTAQISPRIFEAIALRTPLILFEGHYSGILKPHRHYIPLRKDFGNFQEVLGLLRDDSYLRRIAQSAFHEVALDPTYGYRQLVTLFDRVVAEEFTKRGVARSPLPVKHAAFNPLTASLEARQRWKFTVRHLLRRAVRCLPTSWMSEDLKDLLRSLVRPIFGSGQ